MGLFDMVHDEGLHVTLERGDRDSLHPLLRSYEYVDRYATKRYDNRRFQHCSL